MKSLIAASFLRALCDVPVYGHIIDVAGERRITGLIHPAIDGQRMYNYSVSAYVERVALMPKAPVCRRRGAARRP